MMKQEFMFVSFVCELPFCHDDNMTIVWLGTTDILHHCYSQCQLSDSKHFTADSKHSMSGQEARKCLHHSRDNIITKGTGSALTQEDIGVAEKIFDTT